MKFAVVSIIGLVPLLGQITAPVGAVGRPVALDAVLAGASACAGCHQKQFAAYRATPMAQALMSGAASPVLRGNTRLTMENSGYNYTIARQGNEPVYVVTNGRQTISAPISWAFGHGAAAQTFVLEHEGHWYESRVSYYVAIKGLDLTMGAANTTPANIDEAFGRRMDDADTRQCFGCHSTGGLRGNVLEWSKMTVGVWCESCHGPAADHIAKKAAMPSLAKLSTEEQSDFCGACHRTWAQVAGSPLRGPNNVRFQPYRLTNSKCYDASDARIRCTACHDPHGSVVRDISFYDSKCQACHATADGKRCPVGTRDCASCHMPRVELPASHFTFTDHQIRVARKGDPYPN